MSLKTLITMSTKHLAAGSTCPPIKDGVLRCYSMKYCPFAQRTRLVLAFKKISHEIVNINLKRKPEWFVEKFPLSKVPILEKDGQVVYESLLTVDLLNDLFPEPPLYPDDPWQRGQDKSLIESWSLVTTPLYKMFFLRDPSRLPGLQEDIHRGLQLFENKFKETGKKFFGGDLIGMIDYMIWPWYERLPLVSHFTEGAVTFDQYPQLKKWSVAMMEDPAVKETFICPEEHIAYYMSGMSGEPDYDMVFSKSHL